MTTPGKSKKLRKTFVARQEKKGPVASMREGAYQYGGRRFWVVLSNVGLMMSSTPKKAKAEWRKLNARAWQKKVSK